MAKGRKKKKTSGGRLVPFVLFLVAAGVVFWGRHELLWGGKGLLFGEIDFLLVQKQSDLPSPVRARARPAEIVGIPDYKNVVRFPYEGRTLTCYRMVDFGNRLCVCSQKDLAEPKAIPEIIRERKVRGRLEGLNRSPMEERLQRIFQQAGGIRFPEDALLLSEEKSPLPSRIKLGLLVFSLVVCCFSAFRLIK